MPVRGYVRVLECLPRFVERHEGAGVRVEQAGGGNVDAARDTPGTAVPARPLAEMELRAERVHGGGSIIVDAVENMVPVHEESGPGTGLETAAG